VDRLNIPADEFRRLYEGSANTLGCRDQVSGKTVRSPDNVLRQFVSGGGVFVRFEISVGTDNGLQDIRKL